MAEKFIRAGWLIDGKGSEIKEQVLIQIEGESIASIEPWSDGLGVDPENLLDLSHCTILPPLVDAHLHLFLSGTTDINVRKKQLTSSYDELKPVMKQHVEDCFKHGILAVRDCGDHGAYALQFAKECADSSVAVQSCGRAWHRRRQYGRIFGHSPESYNLSLAEAFEKSATQESEQNAQWVKIFASGVNSLTTFGDYGQPHFDQEELTALVEAAKGLGKKVMVHANGEEAVKRAITAGCDSIEHGFFMGEENLNHLRDSGIIWIPTVFTIRAYRENMHLLEAKAKSVVLDRILEHQLGQLSRARELGVKVAVGSDAGSLGVLHGEGLMEEMKLFKKAGYTLPEILYCSSTNGGGLLGLGSYGKVQSHYPATFLVSRGTPFQLPRKIVYLERIIVKGSVME